MSIPNSVENIKQFIKNSLPKGELGSMLVVCLLLIISNSISYKIGQKSVTKTISQPGIILPKNIKNNYRPSYKPGTLAAALAASDLQTKQTDEKSTKQTKLNTTNQGQYVASKNGRVYYFTWCTGAKRIIEENRQYFNTAKDARAAGLTPSKTCAGLD